MNNLKISFPFLFILTLISFSSLSKPSAALSKPLDRASIEKSAQLYLTKHTPVPAKGTVKILVTPIDPRVTIQACNLPLTFNIPDNHNSRNVILKISCDSIKPWRIFLSAKITTTIAVVVAQNYIAKNSILDLSNIKLIQQDIFKIRGEYYNNIRALIGTKTIRSIARGKSINKNDFCLVCIDDRVTIEAGSANFAITTTGIALSNGTLKQFIRVKNSHSGRTISAQIIAPNHVKISL